MSCYDNFKGSTPVIPEGFTGTIDCGSVGSAGKSVRVKIQKSTGDVREFVTTSGGSNEVEFTLANIGADWFSEYAGPYLLQVVDATTNELLSFEDAASTSVQGIYFQVQNTNVSTSGSLALTFDT